MDGCAQANGGGPGRWRWAAPGWVPGAGRVVLALGVAVAWAACGDGGQQTTVPNAGSASGGAAERDQADEVMSGGQTDEVMMDGLGGNSGTEGQVGTPGGGVSCMGGPVGRQATTLAEAQAMGFDLEALSVIEGSFEFPIAWTDPALPSPTTLSVEVQRTGAAILVAWRHDYPDGVLCHDGDFVVPIVSVSVRTADGLLEGSFEMEVEPAHTWQDDPWNNLDTTPAGKRMWLADTGLGIDPLSLSRVPPEGEPPPASADSVELSLHLLFDSPFLAPRADLDIWLSFTDEEGEVDVESLGAHPEDGCWSGHVPEASLDDAILDAQVVEIDKCRAVDWGEGIVCCPLEWIQTPIPGVGSP